MKKIYLSITLIALVLITNFAVWFWQSRIITENFEEFKKVLAFNNIKLTYDEIKFSTFRSWQVDGYLENVKLSYGKEKVTTLEFDLLRFYSRPFDKTINFTTGANIIVNIKEALANNSFKFNYITNNTPTLKVDFEISFSDLLKLFKTPNRKPFYTYIKHLSLNNPEFELVNTHNNFVKMSAKDFLLDLLAYQDEKSRDFEINLSLQKIKYDSNYLPDNEFDKIEQNLMAELGEMNLMFQVHYKEFPSLRQLEYLKTDNIKNIKPVFDTYNINLKTLNFNSEKFNVSMLGQIEKPSDYLIPAGSLKIEIGNYNSLFDYYIKNVNIILGRLATENPFLQISLIQDEKKERFRSYIKTFNPENEVLTLNISRKPNEEIKINERPLFTLFNEMQNIFNSSLSSQIQPLNNNNKSGS